MARTLDDIESLHPVIQKILTASGSPGLSLGVLHDGNIACTAHFGYFDVAKQVPPNDSTNYHVASLTKAITATVVASLVHDGLLAWDVPVAHYLPQFRHRNDQIGQQCTLRDLLSNRTGLAMANAYWGQKHGEFLMPKKEIVNTICHLKAIKPFRSAFVYSQWNYGLVTEIIEAVTGMTFGQYAKIKILGPLNMLRTNFSVPSDDNTASPYAVGDDGTPYNIAHTDMTDESGLAGANAARSNVRDLLSFYRSLLLAYRHQTENGSDITQGSPCRQVREIFSPNVKVGSSAIDDVAYCFGLYRSRLPANLGVSSVNNLLLGPKRMPRVGSTKSGLHVYHHSGNVPGFASSTFLIPSTQTAIVILANSAPFFDPTDFIGQLIVSKILGEQQPDNLMELCKIAKSASLASYRLLSAKLDREKTIKPPRFPLSAYEGKYVNTAGNFFLCITRTDRGLQMNVQGLPLTRYFLYPYDGDIFYWPANRNEELKQCMAPITTPGWHKIIFQATDLHNIDQLIWEHDPFAPPEVFQLQSSPARLVRGRL